MNKDQNSNTPTKSRYATPFDVDRHSGLNYSSISFFQKVSALPDSIKDLMANPSTAEFMEENLGPNFNLDNEQKKKITIIIRDILLGDTSLNSMPVLISSKLNIDPNTSAQIANKIMGGLFEPAIEDLKKIQIKSFPEKINRPITEKPDLKIEPGINKNNVVDLRNKNNNT